MFGLGGALEHLHANGIVLRSFDPQGILMTETVGGIENKTIPRISRIDNAVVQDPSCEFTRGCFGDIRFRAPEVLQNKAYNSKADIWSFGVIAFFILTGKLPFDTKEKDETPVSDFNSISEDEEEIEERIINEDAPFDMIIKAGHCD